MRPDLTGRGLGREVIAAGLAYARARFAPLAFRVTVASFNTRALRVVESLGFERVGSFEANTDGTSFEVLVRLEPPRREDRSRIRVKAMLIAPNAAGTAHAVVQLPPTAENPRGQG